jgi:hypothetical protein
MTLTNLPTPAYTGADLSARVNAIATEARAARRLPTVAALLADATLSYGTGNRPVAVGEPVEAGGFRYLVAATGASDHHVTTAGGVKLYEEGVSFTSLVRFQAKLARGDDYRLGDTVDAAGVAYVKDGGSGLAGLPGWSRTDASLSSQVTGLSSQVNAITSASFPDVATLLASTIPAAAVAVGTVWRTTREGFSYAAAPSNATNHHVTTAGGVKLYVQPGPDGRVNVLAFGADPTGVADATAAFNTAGLRFKSILVPAGLFRVNNVDWSRATVGDMLDVLFHKNARLRADNNATDILNIAAQRRCIFTGGRFMRGAKAFNLGGIGQITAYCKFIDNEFGGIGAAAGDVTYGYWGDTAIANVWQRPVFGSDAAIPSVDYGIFFTGASADQTNNNRIYDPQLLNIGIDGITFADAAGALRHNDNAVIGGLIEEVGGHGILVSRSARMTRIEGMFIEDAGSRSKAPIFLDRTFDATVEKCQFATANRDIHAWIEVNGGSGNRIRKNNYQVQFTNTLTVSGATQANLVALTLTGHGLVTGDRILVQSVGGMTQINARSFKVTVADANTVTLDGENGIGHSAFTSGGSVWRIVPLIRTTGVAADIDARSNRFSNASFVSRVVPLRDWLVNAASEAEARRVLYDTWADTAAFTGDEINFASDNFGHVQSLGFARAVTPTVNLAAQDTWYTVARVEFPAGHTQTLHAIAEVFVGGSQGGALTGHSLFARRKLYRTSGGSFRSDAIGTDFTTGANGVPGTADFQVQIVLDAAQTNVALVQVRRISGATTSSFISPLVKLDASNVNPDSNRIRLLQAS